jgi:hypothetical protein
MMQAIQRDSATGYRYDLWHACSSTDKWQAQIKFNTGDLPADLIHLRRLVLRIRRMTKPENCMASYLGSPDYEPVFASAMEAAATARTEASGFGVTGINKFAVGRFGDVARTEMYSGKVPLPL